MKAHPPPRRPRGRRRWPVAAALLLAVVALFSLDRWIGAYQKQSLIDRQDARKRLERMVLFALRADLDTVEHLPDGGYSVTVRMENVYPENPLWVMVPAVRAFAQVGSGWKEVPTQPGEGDGLRPGQVIALRAPVTVRYRFTLPPDHYAELLQGYYHLQFVNAMLASDVAEPKDDVAERTDNYYVHLLPTGADLAALARVHQFPADRVPPFLPMPPH